MNERDREDMRGPIMMALTDKAEEIGDEVQRVVDQTVGAFDFDHEVAIITRSVMKEILRSTIEYTMKYDDKFQRAVKISLARALRRPE